MRALFYHISHWPDPRILYFRSGKELGERRPDRPLLYGKGARGAGGQTGPFSMGKDLGELEARLAPFSMEKEPKAGRRELPAQHGG